MNTSLRRAALVSLTALCLYAGPARAQMFNNQPSLPPWHDPNESRGLELGANPSVGWGAITQADITPSRTAGVTRLTDGSARIDATVPTGTIFYSRR